MTALTVRQMASARIPTAQGIFELVLYHSNQDEKDHLVLLHGNWQEVDELLVRVHSECQTGDIFGSLRCDCGPQLNAALDRIALHDAQRPDRVRERLRRKVEEVRSEVDEARFEQEMLYYLEKFDITEEKVRLAGHCAHFEETLDGPAQQGRKLGFIAQEMGREMNTIGAKANDADLQRLVVEMKDELEKIKEQVLNVL